MSMPRPRTLIFAQAVDDQDPLFGFFVTWLRGFAVYGSAHVCALRVNPSVVVPEQIRVHSLREKGGGRLQTVFRVFERSIALRRDYDAVFVRGDAIYLVIAGWLWRLLGKRVVFWYTHYSAQSPLFWLGSCFAHEVVTAVPESNPLTRAVAIGHHIPLEEFQEMTHTSSQILHFAVIGRVSAVKRVPWIVDVVHKSLPESSYQLTVVGAPGTQADRDALTSCLNKQVLWIDTGVSPASIKKYYKESDVVISATPGSLDKVIVEAAAAGRIVLSASSAILRGLSPELRWLYVPTEEALTKAIRTLQALSFEERHVIGQALREWAKQHELHQHLRALTSLLSEQASRVPSRTKVKQILNRIFRKTPSGVPVLMFHAFDGQGSTGWDLTRLRALCVRLRSRGIQGISLAEAQTQIVSEQGRVVFTVDDATADLAEAIEILKEYAFPVTVFAPSSIATLTSSEGTTRNILSQEKLQELKRTYTGLSIGGHGITHRSLTSLSLEEAETEIRGSYEYTQLFGEKMPFFAYPRGKYTQAHIPLVLQAGFRGACTVVSGHWDVSTPLMEIPRYPIMRWMTSRDVFSLFE
jgi:peptidoglycan/xylan/chitin deacetylase (PgdA/CDA1 family)